MAVGSAGLLVPVFAPLTALTLAYTGHQLTKLQWGSILYAFFTGPGRASRILLLVFLVMNRKNLPFAWTTRVLGSLFRHVAIRRSPGPPRVLYHYCVTTTHAPLLETDYNFHKSNSTYFSDLDVSRSHLLMHLFAQGMERVTKNAAYKVVRDKEGKLVKGGFGIGLGSVFCSFKREIAPYSKYEMWSRILCFDRKWIYILTHFVDAGKVRPTSWDGKGLFRGVGKVRSAGGNKSAGGTAGDANGRSVDPSIATSPDFEKHIFATAVTKYVFKLGRFTVHPAIVIEESGLLPERPGGWRSGESETGTPEDLSGFEAELASAALNGEATWDWRRTEWERRKGMAFAEHFAALDGMHALFDGGDDGALGHFTPA